MNTSKSIEQLEREVWKHNIFPTLLVEKCHAYRKIQINKLSIEQTRLLIGQKIGVKFLLPKAISFLQDDLLSEGDFYPGDLLVAVLSLTDEDWKENEELRNELRKLIKDNRHTLPAIGSKKLMNRVDAFLEKH